MMTNTQIYNTRRAKKCIRNTKQEEPRKSLLWQRVGFGLLLSFTALAKIWRITGCTKNFSWYPKWTLHAAFRMCITCYRRKLTFHGSRLVFHIFSWFQVGFSWFLVRFYCFSLLQVGFYGFSWFIIFHVENTLRLYFGPTIQSRPCRPSITNR